MADNRGLITQVVEGFVGGVADRLRRYAIQDRDRALQQMAKGYVPGQPAAGSGYSVLGEYGMAGLEEFMATETDLMSRYVDYIAMDQVGDLSTALDIFGDDSTQSDTQLKRSVWVTAKDRKIQRVLEEMIKTVRLEEEMQEIARSLCKFGNDFEEILVTEQGIQGLTHLPAVHMRRVEGKRGDLQGFIQDRRGRLAFNQSEFSQILQKRMAVISGSTSETEDPALTAFEDWEVVHFRLRNRDRQSVYGIGVLEGARGIWKRLALLEDSALIFRLQRSPERFAFYVDVGNIPPAEAQAELQKFRHSVRKKRYVNPTSGKIDLRYDVLAQEDDFYLPVRNGSDAVRVQTMQSPQWQCVTGDTRIWVVPPKMLAGYSPSGRGEVVVAPATTEPVEWMTIAEMAAQGGEYPVFSVDARGAVVPGRAHSARMTFESAELWAITLDNGEVVRCTHNHPFLTVGGEWRQASSLVAGVQLASGRTALPIQLSRGLQRSVVSAINTGTYEAVYDLTVDEHHNFATVSGVVLHNSIDDINYFKDKQYAAIKVPKGAFGQDEVQRSILSSQDVRFARNILRIQRVLKDGTSKMGRVHLAALNIDPKGIDYTVNMTVPSAIYELAQLEVWNARADLAARMDAFVSRQFILSELMGLSDDKIKKIFMERGADKDRDAEDQARTESIAQQAALASQPPPEEGAPPQESRRVDYDSNRLYSNRIPQHLRTRNPKVRSLSERELTEGGSKLHEREVKSQLDKILQNDTLLAKRLSDLGHLLHDIAAHTNKT